MAEQLSVEVDVKNVTEEHGGARAGSGAGWLRRAGSGAPALVTSQSSAYAIL